MSRSQLNYQSRKREDLILVKALLKIKEKHNYYGRPRVLSSLRRMGFVVSSKKVRRLLTTLNLLVPRKKHVRKLKLVPSDKKPLADNIGKVWSMDFVFDRLKDGTPFRCFTIIDNFSREVPGIFVSRSMAGFSPINFLERVKEQRALPKHFILDNGVEFKNAPFISWCKKNEISLHFIDPGRPVQNAYIESFNGKFRQEFLSQHSFKKLADVRTKLDEWINYYNVERPHSSLDYLTPKEFVEQQRAC